MVARRFAADTSARMPHGVLMLAIAIELSAAGYVFYEGLMNMITGFL